MVGASPGHGQAHANARGVIFVRVGVIFMHRISGKI
jgi:hypothetical protein